MKLLFDILSVYWSPGKEAMRISVEDLSKLLTVHTQRCIHARVPTMIIRDLREVYAELEAGKKRIEELDDNRSDSEKDALLNVEGWKLWEGGLGH